MHAIKVNELFNSDLQSSIQKIIEYTINAKFFEKPPKIRKSDLSPNRIISTRERKAINHYLPAEQNKTTLNEKKHY